MCSPCNSKLSFIDLARTYLTDAIARTCAYETVALGFSSFCGLFTEEEWKGYEYFNGTGRHLSAVSKPHPRPW
jgi:hypothetical protein